MLFLGNGNASDPRAAFLDGVFRETAPPTADFKNMVTRLDIRQIGKISIFVALRSAEIIAVPVYTADE